MKLLKKTTCLFLSLLLVAALPVQALAADFSIEGGTDGTDYVYTNSGVDGASESLTIKTETPLIISNSNPDAPVNDRIFIGEEGSNINANVTLNNVKINTVDADDVGKPAITVRPGNSADVTLVGENTAISGAGYAGVRVNSDAKLTITKESTGSLLAQGDNNSAGIGGHNGAQAGTIIISGGDVTAIGGSGAAGIGSGRGGYGGTIIIDGGTVKAQGGENGAGIGSGHFNNSGDTIFITGGNVEATGGSNGAGIGGGNQNYGGSISISGGNVEATGGTGAEAIGNGNGGVLATTEFSNGDVTTTVDGTVIFTGNTPAVSGNMQPTPAKPVSNIWDTIVYELSKTDEGSTYTLDLSGYTYIASSVIKAARARNITLIIQWDGGADITVKPTDTIDLTHWSIQLKDLA